MFDDIETIRRTRKKYNAQMFLSGIGSFRELAEAEFNALKDGALSQKSKELIALGISVGNACYG